MVEKRKKEELGQQSLDAEEWGSDEAIDTSRKTNLYRQKKVRNLRVENEELTQGAQKNGLNIHPR